MNMDIYETGKQGEAVEIYNAIIIYLIVCCSDPAYDAILNRQS
jgi:hypothetical protein